MKSKYVAYRKGERVRIFKATKVQDAWGFCYDVRAVYAQASERYLDGLGREMPTVTIRNLLCAGRENHYGQVDRDKAKTILERLIGNAKRDGFKQLYKGKL